MAFANNTLVSVNSSDKKPINSFAVGDIVYAADETNPSLWRQQAIQFSMGTPDEGRQPMMIYLTYKLQGGEGRIVVTLDHPFLTAAKQVKRADRLTPDIDQLLAASGESIEILSIAVGSYNGDVHDIAVTTRFDTPGHWIVANSIVCGDYRILQTQE